MLNKKTYLFIALAWTFIITVLSLISLGDIGSEITIPNKDKYVHFTFYFVFVVVWLLFFKNKRTSAIMRIIFLSAIGYGILMEFLQGFTKTRTPDIMDVCANSFGALTGLLVVILFLKNKKSHS